MQQEPIHLTEEEVRFFTRVKEEVKNVKTAEILRSLIDNRQQYCDINECLSALFQGIENIRSPRQFDALSHTFGSRPDNIGRASRTANT